jgi:hypothetical protein
VFRISILIVWLAFLLSHAQIIDDVYRAVGHNQNQRGGGGNGNRGAAAASVDRDEDEDYLGGGRGGGGAGAGMSFSLFFLAFAPVCSPFALGAR